MKDKLLVSFSSGETSAYMSWWLKENKSDQYDMIFVMANTGEENEESLVFPVYENDELSGHELDKTGDCFGSCEPFK